MGLEDTLAVGVADGKIPHAVVGATNKDGTFIYDQATGKMDLSSNASQITNDSLFMMASQTKLLTTIACLQAVERGLLTLDADVSPTLTEFKDISILTGFDASTSEPILVKRTKPLTLRQLLTHTSGIAYDAFDRNLMKYQAHRNKPLGAGSTVETRYDFPLVFEPGTSWTYGAGIDWAGKLLERTAGTTLETWMHEHMFPQLGIEKRDITFWPEKAGAGARVPQLTTRTPEAKLSPFTEPFLNTGSEDCFGGHGGYGTVPAYLKVLRSLLKNDGRLLKPETVTGMVFEPQLSGECQAALQQLLCGPYGAFFIGEAKPEVEVSYGLGGMLYLRDDQGRRKKGTLSWGGVCNTFWTVDPASDLALVFATQVLPPGDKSVEEMINATEYGVNQMAAK